ncbi:MAG: T9SS type A sorting domain-containing protein, partial [Bacteroidota bacterium]
EIGKSLLRVEDGWLFSGHTTTATSLSKDQALVHISDTGDVIQAFTYGTVEDERPHALISAPQNRFLAVSSTEYQASPSAPTSSAHLLYLDSALHTNCPDQILSLSTGTPPVTFVHPSNFSEGTWTSLITGNASPNVHDTLATVHPICTQVSTDAPVESSLIAAPNPSHHQIRISGFTAAGTWRLFDATGRLLDHGQITQTLHDLELDMHKLARGLYWFQHGNTVLKLLRD